MSSKPRLYYRDRDLVLNVLAYLVDADDDPDSDEPVPEAELVSLFAEEAGIAAKTVETVLYDLRRFGAVYRAGAMRKARRPATYRITDLGRAWLEGERLPMIGEAELEEASS